MNGYCPLASGSKGNCIYVGTPQTKVLIDAGISVKAISSKLAEINVDLSEIDAVLISHEHSDHIKGLPALAKKLGIPVFANSETAKAIYQEMQGDVKFKIFSTGESFEYGDLEIHPFSIQHDTLDPVAFTIRTNSLKLGFCTDLGFVTALVRSHLKGCDYLYLEANHQPSMVHSSARPMVYKQRVLSRQGHLSNEDCANLLVDVFHPQLKHVYLAHLSSECNTEEVALKVIREKLALHQLEVPISIAYQDVVSQPIYFDRHLCASV